MGSRLNPNEVVESQLLGFELAESAPNVEPAEIVLVVEEIEIVNAKSAETAPAGEENAEPIETELAAKETAVDIARIFLFIFFFIHLWTHFDEASVFSVKEIFPLGFYSLLVVPPVLTMMNLFWFWKIAKGLVRTLSKAKHSE
ncbi:hypothetical protein ACSQ67_012022 [Phaseolus vulgaris]